MTLQRKLEILSDAAKYDASCASSGGEKRNALKGAWDPPGLGDLSCLCARWALHFSSQNPDDQFLHVRLRLLRQPGFQQCRTHALFR